MIYFKNTLTNEKIRPIKYCYSTTMQFTSLPTKRCNSVPTMMDSTYRLTV